MIWANVTDGLRRWHEHGDRAAARAVLEFLEPELRLMVPAVVRRRWPEDLVEDALLGFLTKLLEKSITSELSNPQGFFARAFRNYCIDRYEQRQRQPESNAVDVVEVADLSNPDQELQDGAIQRQQTTQAVQAALGTLELADRVALKLEHAPESLTDEEVEWLASRAGRSFDDVHHALLAADDMYAITRIFDPGDDDPRDLEARRLRMERFRRRRGRARDKLLELLRGDE